MCKLRIIIFKRQVVCDCPPENAHVYVRDCLLKYLDMLEQSDSVHISHAANDWQKHIDRCRGSILTSTFRNDGSKRAQNKIMKTVEMKIEYRGEIVGVVRNVVPDKWQTEGDWLRTDSPMTLPFELFAASVNPTEIVNHVRMGKVIRCHLNEDEPYMAYVLGLTGNRLVFRRFSSRKDSDGALERYEE